MRNQAAAAVLLVVYLPWMRWCGDNAFGGRLNNM